ncbi:MAG: TonB-dependent receptor plug domain-containing protein, partial [Turneriella sp.]|nr:TonB-dependent receptor plug domain-containing protein [Turneriella sp.]
LKQGEYTLRLTAPGHRSVAEKIRVPLRKNALTLPVEVRRTQTVRLITYEEKHSVSRHQLEQHEIKSVPATFGDNLSALATLPGVNRPGGIFGPLVIRGAPDTANRYFLDDIPIINPQHFGGFQSVIANELIDELTLISSAFPAFYGQALAAVIDIRTLEAVPKARSTVEAGIISTNAFFAAPWAFFAPKPMPLPGNATEEERRTHAELQKQSQLDTGFFSISGRVGYLSLLVPPLYKIFTGRELIAVPEYYDYQWKSRWYPGATQRHALTFFVFGSYDTFTLVRRLSEEEKRERVEQGENPAAGDLTVFNDISSHTQSLSYDFRPERNIKLRTLFFNTLIFSRFYRDAPANALGAINVVTRPNIAGVREIFDIHYLDRRGRLRGGIDYQFFYFNTSGVTQQRKETIPSGMTNFNDPNHFDVIDVTVSGQNHLISAYADNRLEFGGFFLSPGVRSDHLSRSGETTFNVRGLGGYKFRSGTTFAFSGGTYSSFAQTNFHRFNQATRREVRVVEAGYLRSEKAIHRSVALEQEWGFHILRAEAFYNNLYDLIQATPAAAQAQGVFYANTGAALTRWIELSYRKSLYENEDGFFGWVSYTYTRADVSGVAGSFPFRFEQRHVVKLIGVLRIAGWEFGARFELFTGFPYTPIVGSYCAPGYLCDGNPATTFYAPVYSNAINSANYPLFHRLDLRLTRRNHYSWGNFSWFIEFINVYNNEPLIRQVFRNSEPYQPGRNPTLRGPTIPLNLIPNFGLEWKF